MDIVNIVKGRISLNGGLIEFEGGEEFVTKQLEEYVELLKTCTNSIQNKKGQVMTGEDTVHTVTDNVDVNAGDDKFMIQLGVNKEVLNNIIHTDEEDFTIITTEIKGSKAEKQVNYCLIYCLMNEFYGKQVSSYKELRELCEYFGCLDETNFATILSRNKKFFIIEGEKRSRNKNVKLTAPGKEEARKLISGLVGE